MSAEPPGKRSMSFDGCAGSGVKLSRSIKPAIDQYSLTAKGKRLNS